MPKGSRKVVPLRPDLNTESHNYEDLTIKVPIGYRAIVTYIPKDVPVTIAGSGNNIIGTVNTLDSTGFYSLPTPINIDQNDITSYISGEEISMNGEKEMFKNFLSLKTINFIAIMAIFAGILFSLIGDSVFTVGSLLTSVFLIAFSMFAIRRVAGIDIINPGVSVFFMLGSLGLLITLFLTLL